MDAGSGGGGGGADAGAGGGTAADCEGILPAQIGSSFSFDVPTSSSAERGCDRSTSDESGNIAAVGPSSSVSYDWLWYLYDPKGARLAITFAFDLFPQGSGYESVYPYDTGDFRVAAWTPDGKRTLGSRVAGEMVPGVFRAWPNGLFVVTPSCDPRGTTGNYTLRLFDPFTNEKASATFGGCGAVLSAVVDADQSWLVVIPGSAVGLSATDAVAQWFDSTGKSLTSWFKVGALAPKQRFVLHALIGGGAVLQQDGLWTAFIPSGKAEVQPAPAFLASHPEADFTLVRGARAYAVLPRTGDTTEMELYSASGNRCGSLKFTAGGLTTGADGTVIASSGDQGCTKTVWPGLLK